MSLASGLKEHFYEVASGRIMNSSEITLPPASIDRLFLVAAAGLDPFRPLYDAFSHMGFYNFSPSEIREMQPPNIGEVLSHVTGVTLRVFLNLWKKNDPTPPESCRILRKGGSWH